MNNRNLFLLVLEARKPNSKVLASGRALLLHHTRVEGGRARVHGRGRILNSPFHQETTPTVTACLNLGRAEPPGPSYFLKGPTSQQ